MDTARIAAVRKIAVVRANGIGDFCFSLPALVALREAYPEAEIVLLGKAWHHAFLSARTGPIDRVVVVPPYGGVNGEPGTPADASVLEAFFDAMRAEQFDIAIQLHGGGRHSNPFVRRLGARVTVGLRTPDAERLDRYIPYLYFQPEILRYLEVVALVAAKPVSLEPAIALAASDIAEIERLDIDLDRPFAVLHPGATDPRRRWPVESFAAVGRSLARVGARLVIVGSGAEAPLVHDLVDRLGTGALALCDRLSLGGLAALLARSRVVVGNDSGPLHLAGAVGACTAGIYWCGNMINGGPPTRRRHRPLISWRLDCTVCGRNTLFDNCSHRESFVADVRIDDVSAAALDLYRGETTAA